MDEVTVRVSATTANIGPGFDCVGMALSIYDTLTFRKADGLKITGCEKIYQNENNLAFVAYKKTLEKMGVADFGVEINISSEIPVSRGLGSSAALIAAGAAAANALWKGSLTKADLLEIGSGIEGHPDNLAPALYGGLTCSAQTENDIFTARYEIDEGFSFVALIPPFPLSTEKARQVLPNKVDRKDAVYNISRTVLLLKALETGDGEMLKVAVSDRLHERYRKELIPGYETALEIAKELSASMFISGAGPTLMMISRDKSFIERLSEKTKASLLSKWRILDLKPDNRGINIG